MRQKMSNEIRYFSMLQKIKTMRKRLRSERCCEWCGTPNNLTIDYIKPICQGGLDIKGNYRILCWRCHKRHQQEDKLYEWIRYKLYLETQ